MRSTLQHLRRVWTRSSPVWQLLWSNASGRIRLDARAAAEHAEHNAAAAQTERDEFQTRSLQEFAMERTQRQQLEQVVLGLEGQCERYR